MHARSGGDLAATTGGKAELMHHPVGLGSFSGASSVVNQRLLKADAGGGVASCGVYRPVDAGRLPKTRPGHPIRPDAVPVLPPPEAKEVPLLLSGGDDFCNSTIKEEERR